MKINRLIGSMGIYFLIAVPIFSRATEHPASSDKSLTAFVNEFVTATKKNDLDFVKKIAPDMPEQNIPSFFRMLKPLIENAEQNQKSAIINCDNMGVCSIEWPYTDNQNPSGNLKMGVKV